MHDTSTKVVGRRVVGFLVDTIVIWVIASVLFAVMADRGGRIPERNSANIEVNGEQWVLAGSSYVVWIVLIVLAVLAIAVVLEGRTGWTPGKLLLGVRVVDAEGERPGMARALARLLGWIVDGLPWVFLWGLTGLVTSAASKGNRRVGDMMGGTYVVKKEAVGRPVVVEGAGAQAPGSVPAAPAAAAPKADWYPDPAGKTRLRYWDGSAWTEHTAD